MRARRDLPSLRFTGVFAALRVALAQANRHRFRVNHFSVQADHLHLIVEASSREALIRGLQGMAGRVARAVNRCLRRRGKVWSGRYHARDLTTPREVRNTLAYVLLNFRKHLRTASGIDPCSSGAWFDGWARSPAPAGGPSPVASSRTWLGTEGWRRAGGLIDPTEAPAGPSGAPGASGRGRLVDWAPSR
jgi:REP element-mobilizing transposase RayT